MRIFSRRKVGKDEDKKKSSEILNEVQTENANLQGRISNLTLEQTKQSIELLSLPKIPQSVSMWNIHHMHSRNALENQDEKGMEVLKSISTSKIPSTHRRVSIEKQVEMKLAIARTEKDKYLEKLENNGTSRISSRSRRASHENHFLENVESRGKSGPLPKLLASCCSHSFLLENNSTFPNYARELSKQEEAKSRREKLQETEQLDKIQKYSAHHEKRPGRLEVIHCFETSKRQRFLLQVVILANYWRKILIHKTAEPTCASITFHRRRSELFRVIQAKKMLAELEKKRERSQKARLNRTMLLFVIRCRLRRRIAAASLITSYLSSGYLDKSDLKNIFLRLKQAVRIVQRNARALRCCTEARLFAMQLWVFKVLNTLKSEAEEYKKKKVVFWEQDKDTLFHPRYNFDLGLPIEGDSLNSTLIMYIEMKKNEWIAYVDFKRKQAQTQKLDFNDVRVWLEGSTQEPPTVPAAQQRMPSTSIRKKYPFSNFQLYSTSTQKDIIRLIQATYEAKYPPPTKDKIKNKACSVGGVNFVELEKKNAIKSK